MQPGQAIQDIFMHKLLLYPTKKIHSDDSNNRSSITILNINE